MEARRYHQRVKANAKFVMSGTIDTDYNPLSEQRQYRCQWHFVAKSGAVYNATFTACLYCYQY